MYGQHLQQSMDHSGMVANTARGMIKQGELNISLSPFATENLISRDRFGRPIPRQPAHSPYSG